jgi:hypothetical protein
VNHALRYVQRDLRLQAVEGLSMVVPINSNGDRRMCMLKWLPHPDAPVVQSLSPDVFKGPVFRALVGIVLLLLLCLC